MMSKEASATIVKFTVLGSDVVVIGQNLSYHIVNKH